MEHVEMHVSSPHVQCEKLAGATLGEGSAIIRERVEAACQLE